MQSILPEAFLAVILGNFMTAWAVYFMWRLKRNENDWIALAGMLFLLLIVGIGAYSIRYPT